ncbi:TIGR03745 family integrating conjugative element membrane protein [Photobacterium damselae]|uniref:TIGR03745 family integrating conjugative element membrane protein n=1 Tax=Photobacterium damselae TaxID=38293 RepID=UPI0040691CBD
MKQSIKNTFKKPLSVAKKAGAAVSGLALQLAVAQQVYAVGLPTAAIPGGGASNDYIKTSKNILFGIIGLVVAVVVLIMFIVSAKNTIKVYNEWRDKKATFEDVGITLAVTIGLILAVLWLLNTASSQFGLTF